MLHEPMLDVGYIISEWQRAITGLKRISDLLNYTQDENLLDHEHNVKESSSFNFSISLKNVSFTFADDSKEIIKNFSISVAQGERLGIKGEIGSGKSTLLNLISGLERNYTGEIRIGDLEIHSKTHHELREIISIVSQKPFLFADTIRNNLELNKILQGVV